MPQSESPTKTQESKWITIHGRRVEIKPGEEAEDKIREALPTVRGEKERNTKQALSKAFVKRIDLIKGFFNTRDEVIYYTKLDENEPQKYMKYGMVAGFDGNMVKIFDGNSINKADKNFVFKKSELLGEQHWDTISIEDRSYWLDKSGLDYSFVNTNWMNMQPVIRKSILKTATPAGYETSNAGNSNPIYNPINEDKTISQRIKEQEEKEHKNDDEHAENTQ